MKYALYNIIIIGTTIYAGVSISMKVKFGIGKPAFCFLVGGSYILKKSSFTNVFNTMDITYNIQGISIPLITLNNHNNFKRYYITKDSFSIRKIIQNEGTQH